MDHGPKKNSLSRFSYNFAMCLTRLIARAMRHRRRKEKQMDPGTVVWLPGSGFSQDDYNAACGGYACGTEQYGDGVLVYCCPN